MHTVIQMSNGTVRLRLYGEEDSVDTVLWRKILCPAIAHLQSSGGGTMFVFHHPHDLVSR